MFDDLIDFLNTVVSVLEDIGLFLWSIVKFVVFAFKSLFNLVYKAFSYIFSDSLFNSLSDSFQNISLLIWTQSTLILVSLFFISFVLLFLSFIFRLLKWSKKS